MLNFKFRGASSAFAGIELIHMIRNGQFATYGVNARSVANQFFKLSGMVRPFKATHRDVKRNSAA